MSKKIIGRHSFCPIPFLQLQLNPLGNVSACCFSGEHKVGDVKTSSIEEIWNNEKMKSWRREFIDDDIKICKAPMQSFECHKMYDHLKQFVVLEEVQPALPRRLDLRLHGKCNLECIMCDVWKQPNNLYDDSDFWKLGPEQIFPYLLEVDMLGGEPFIQKDTYRMIDEVSGVNPNCTWGFITNAAYNFNQKIESSLDKIKLRHIHLSLDSVVPETYVKIRKNGSYEQTFKTVDAYVAYRERRRKKGPDFPLFASMCVQKENWSEIPDFIRFCEERDLQPILQSVIGREPLSLASLTTVELNSILEDVSPFLHGKVRFTVLPVYEEVMRLLERRNVQVI
jgi:MoaA/NifB/PqqE/SkfB family radical SAM enzyme